MESKLKDKPYSKRVRVLVTGARVLERAKFSSNKRHELKILPIYFESVRRGIKSFEIRKDDRGFSVGDTLILKEWRNEIKDDVGNFIQEEGYTGRELEKDISYIQYGGQYGMEKGYVILSLV